jgi:hypothetical protein
MTHDMTSSLQTFLESRAPNSRRAACGLTGVLVAALALAACSNPATPSPPIVPPPPPPPPNTPPVILSLTAARATLEVNESVQLSAVVEDLESTADQLVFFWSAPIGSFVGQGAQVEWRPSLDAPTPATPALTLTIVERYPGVDSLGKIATFEHRVSRSVSVRLHNSPKELGDMGISFLEKFSNSLISPEACLVDFSSRCAGRQAELEDIQENRELFVILSRELGAPRVTSLTKYVRADVRISCAFVSRRLKCPPGEAGCVVGSLDRANGDCRMTAVYEQARWWLCESRFSGNTLLPAGMKQFFGSVAFDSS